MRKFGGVPDWHAVQAREHVVKTDAIAGKPSQGGSFRLSVGAAAALDVGSETGVDHELISSSVRDVLVSGEPITALVLPEALNFEVEVDRVFKNFVSRRRVARIQSAAVRVRISTVIRRIR